MTDAIWDAVRNVPACRLAEVPRRRLTDDSDAAGRDDSRDQRLAALVSACHGSEPVMIGWRRAQAAGRVEVYVGGEALITEGGAGTAVLSLPAGGRGRVLRSGAVADVMNDLPHWTRIGGIIDGLLTDDQPDAAGPMMRPSLEDCLLSVWTEPFAWLLLAEPVSLAETGRLADDVADRAYTAQSMAERSPENAVQAQRLERRHRELRQAASSGSLTVRVPGVEGMSLAGDGPYAEAKEVLAGFYLLECDSIERAVEHAERIPEAAYGLVEIRPVMESHSLPQG